MTQLRNPGDYAEARGFLFSPSSCYPTPMAYVVDHNGAVLHTWSHTAHQPRADDNPPNYLRGWNHVEVDSGGSLFAVVPLRSLLRLTPDSELEWACDVAAHHDLALADDGSVLVLTEAPRLVPTGESSHVVLDNLVAFVSADGTLTRQVSLYDLLRTHPSLLRLIDATIERRSEALRRRGWPTAEDQVPPDVADETREILRTGTHPGERRRALQLLRALPGKPCDILHTNTLEILDTHPSGLWRAGDVLLCIRELDVVVVADLERGEVRWFWGVGELSGPHQPSALPDGRILIFDNGVSRQRSRLVIVDPRTDQTVWIWSAQPPESFHCPLAGGCERLPDGNLLVTNSTAGAAFELAPDGEVVWQLELPAALYGPERRRVSIYRMSAVPPEVLARLRAHRARRTSVPGTSGVGT